VRGMPGQPALIELGMPRWHARGITRGAVHRVSRATATPPELHRYFRECGRQREVDHAFRGL